MSTDSIRVVVKQPGTAPSVTDLPASLEGKQALVGGRLEVLALDGYDLVSNDDSLSERLPLNIVVAGDGWEAAVFGPVFFAGVTPQGGTCGLTDQQIADIQSRWRGDHLVYVADDAEPPADFVAAVLGIAAAAESVRSIP